jgi:hypothetical protein
MRLLGSGMRAEAAGWECGGEMGAETKVAWRVGREAVSVEYAGLT